MIEDTTTHWNSPFPKEAQVKVKKNAGMIADIVLLYLYLQWNVFRTLNTKSEEENHTLSGKWVSQAQYKCLFQKLEHNWSLQTE